MAPRDQTIYTVYPLQNYSFGTKDRKDAKDKDIESKLARLKSSFETKGMRRSVEGIIIVQEHNHPHVLLLQITHNLFKLPGGRLKVDEDEIDGLKRKLSTALSPTNPALQTAWDVGECAGIFWRPNFDNTFYPYVPSHITRPKECKKLFVIPLPDKAMFAVPRNMRLVAVPLYELYDNVGRYGPVLASLPLCLSRYRLNLIRNQPVPEPAPPAANPTAKSASTGGADHHTEDQKPLKVETMVS